MTSTNPDTSSVATPEIVSTKAFAERIGVTPSYVRRLQRDRALPKKGRDEIPLVDGLVALIDFLRDEERRSSKSASATRLHDARAREVELRIAREEGRLVDFEDAQEVFSDVQVTLRRELDGVPAAVTRDLSLRAAIKRAMDAAFSRASDSFERKAAALKAGRDPLETHPSIPGADDDDE